MKIIELRAENFKALKAVRIRPDGAVTQITGPNEGGKTSVLDAIWSALGGKDAAPDRPIRDGAKDAETEIRLDEDLVVRRRFTPGGTTLAVTSADGKMRHSSPQAVVDALLAGSTIDPMAFITAKPADQVATLAALAGIDEASYAARRKAAYDERTGVNRDLKAAEGALAALQPVPADAPAEEVSSSEVAARMEAARRIGRERAEAERLAEAARVEVARIKAAIEDLEARLARGRETLARAELAGDGAIRALAESEDPPSTETIAAELAAIEAGNAAVRLRTQRAGAERKVTDLRASSDALTATLDGIAAERKAAIAAASLPVPGLAWDESGVTLDGIPLTQVATSQKIRTGCAIAMARNPKLRVLRVDRGESLDPMRLEILAQWAEENDVQVWMERVDASGGVGVYIEDGEVRAIDGVPVAEE